MRTLALVAGLLLATALVSFAPAAEAGPCTSLRSDCYGLVCLSTDALEACVGDSCQYQSDCCRNAGLWCPETEDA